MTIKRKEPVLQSEVFEQICELLHIPKGHRKHCTQLDIHIPLEGFIEYTMKHNAFKTEGCE